jgi:hypothetical protein
MKLFSTFPCHDYDEDEYILKPAGLRDTHSEGKVMDLLSTSHSGARNSAQLRYKMAPKAAPSARP